MAWIQPFLNWVAGMIPTKDDFNRIEGNTQYLKDEIDTQTADLALGLQNHETAVDPHTQYTLDSEYNGHVGFQATESAKGHIEIATQAEVTAGTDTKRAVVPKYLKTELDKRLLSSAYTAADVLAKIKTVDGAGSGLDADLIQGRKLNELQIINLLDMTTIGAENQSSANITSPTTMQKILEVTFTKTTYGMFKLLVTSSGYLGRSPNWYKDGASFQLRLNNTIVATWTTDSTTTHTYTMPDFIKDIENDAVGTSYKFEVFMKANTTGLSQLYICKLSLFLNHILEGKIV